MRPVPAILPGAEEDGFRTFRFRGRVAGNSGGIFRQSADAVRDPVARIVATPGKELVNLGSHEQYSYPFYTRCLSDHLERLRLMAELMAEAGYSSVFPAESPESCF